MRYSLLILVLFVTVVSCKKANVDDNEKDIVLEFSDQTIISLICNGALKFHYINDDLLEEEVRFDSADNGSIKSITPLDKILSIQASYNRKSQNLSLFGSQKLNILPDSIPFYFQPNHQSFDYITFRDSALFSNALTSESYFYDFLNFKNSDQNKIQPQNEDEELNKDILNLKEKALIEIGKEADLLDSLLREQKITVRAYYYYTWLNELDKFKILLSTNDIVNENPFPLDSFFLSTIYEGDSIQLIYHAFEYRELMTTIYTQNFAPSQPIYTKEGLDYVLSPILTNQSIPAIERTMISRIALLDNLPKLSVEEETMMVEQYSKNQQDTAFKTYYNSSKINPKVLDLPTRLVNTNQKEMGLEELIRNNRGRVIYLDFWATWCLPCYQQFPYIEALIAKYHPSEFMYIHISVDDDYEKWQGVIQKYGIKENSYIIKQGTSQKLFEQLNLNSIPRYLLLDSKGEVVHLNAPRPSSTQEENLITRTIQNAKK
tara:strand:+ start:4406 stop:5872 length:1467 start_codon:yes stop_codon:yes gene_type:complete